LDLLVSCELGDIVERGAFGLGEERTVAVPIEGVEFTDVYRRFRSRRRADIHAEETDIETRHLFANKKDGLLRQLEFLVPVGRSFP